ncbi:Kelch repeat and BTB domain-containing protein 8 [Branchiostoma belcheri]|nr:Kelch repeat and BTB domain-containing protein 8 [Branchiostoma belcheri]
MLRLEDTTSQAERLLQTLQDMRQKELLTDVILEVEGRSFPCHRNVLAANSPYFSAMFAGGLAESKQDRVTINGISQHIMGLILDYFYTGILEVTEDQVQELCAAACVHQCDQIREECSKFLLTKVCETNCVGMFAFSDSYGMEDLKYKSQKYVELHFKTVWNTPDFLQLPQCQVAELLSLDGLYVDNEETVLESAKSWLKESQEREQFGLEILSCIRLPQLSKDALKRVSEFLGVEQEFVDLELERQSLCDVDTTGQAERINEGPDTDSDAESNAQQEDTSHLVSQWVPPACRPRLGTKFKEMIIFQTKLVDSDGNHGFPAYEPRSGTVYALNSQRVGTYMLNNWESTDYIVHSLVATPNCDLFSLTYIDPETWDHGLPLHVHCLVRTKGRRQLWRYHGYAFEDENFDLRYSALAYLNEHVYTVKFGLPDDRSQTWHWLYRKSMQDMIGVEIAAPWKRRHWGDQFWEKFEQLPAQRVGTLAACGDLLYFIGDTVFCSCDPDTRTVTPLTLPPEPISKLDERPVLTAYKGLLYFLKHRTTTDRLPTLQIYDPTEGKWRVGPRLPLLSNKVRLFILQLVVYDGQLVLIVGTKEGSWSSPDDYSFQISFFKYGARCWEQADIDLPPIGKYLSDEVLPFSVSCVVAKLMPESLECGERFLL